ncbi:DUF5337 domain-containing protein [Thetidibacter halocola]|uniref:DUF5337 domain-containing protein n=1 Tax=Thetidibacter halocola TaxID=2827239 RepID=A0A8J8B883_9RHOB|nr:DUF5337 domain-containing protein [Thetidibacter halocola]MBS0124290.1 DUF5337 domain-containing protein [Thetidibacter halocola]
MPDRDSHNRKGRQIALVIAGTGMAWIAATAIGASAGWTHRTLALFDMAALAGFAFAIWMIYGLWRERRNNKD